MTFKRKSQKKKNNHMEKRLMQLFPKALNSGIKPGIVWDLSKFSDTSLLQIISKVMLHISGITEKMTKTFSAKPRSSTVQANK